MKFVDELLLIAEQAESSGDVDQALDAWKKIAEVQPTAKAYARLGQLEEESGHWQRAQQAFEMASKIQQSWSFPFTCLAMLDLTRTDIPKSLALEQSKSNLMRSIAIEETAVAWSILGTVERELGRDDEARSAFEKSLEIDPVYEEAAFNLAELEEDRDPLRARLLVEKVLSISPDHAGAHQAYGKLLQKEGRLDDAIRQFEASVRLDPMDYWSHLYLANALSLSGDLSTAETAFRQALKIDPENMAGRKFFAKFLEEGSRGDEAAAVLAG